MCVSVCTALTLGLAEIDETGVEETWRPAYGASLLDGDGSATSA